MKTTDMQRTMDSMNDAINAVPHRPEMNDDLPLDMRMEPHDVEVKSEQEIADDVKRLIEELPEDYGDARKPIIDDIRPLVHSLPPDLQQYYVRMISRQVKMKIQTIADLVLPPVNVITSRADNEENMKKKEPLTPEMIETGKEMAQDPLLIKRRIDAVNRSGVVGERKVISMYFASLDSRLLLGQGESPDVISLKNSGHFGAGKSYSLTKCLQIYPEDAYHLITNGSSKSMFYFSGGLKHKALIVTEGFEFQGSNGKDSELAYAIRSLISEGRLSYMVTLRDENGELKTYHNKLEGPTSFITTTVLESLESQLEDRLFTIHPDESNTQTKEIIRFTALQRAGIHRGLDKTELGGWKSFHKDLKPVTVIIPFAGKIADHLTRADRVPMSTRRAFKRVMAIIQTISCAYQHQREVDDDGRIIAEMSDYWMALQIVNEAFQENMGLQSRTNEKRIEDLKKNGPMQLNDLAQRWNVSSTAVSEWAKVRTKKGILTWCNKGGRVLGGEELQIAKYSGLAYLKVSDEYSIADRLGLPTPFDLTGDPEWDEGGELLQRFDLELDPQRVEEVDRCPGGDQTVSNRDLDTSMGPEPVVSGRKSRPARTRVKVTRPILDPPQEKDEEEERAKQDLTSEQLAKEINEILQLNISQDHEFEFPPMFRELQL